MGNEEYCTKCGHYNPSEAIFCQKCGHEIIHDILNPMNNIDVNSSQELKPTETENSSSDGETNNKNNSKKYKIVKLTIILIIFGLITGYGLSWIYHPQINELKTQYEELTIELDQTNTTLLEIKDGYEELQKKYDNKNLEINQINNELIRLKADLDSSKSDKIQLIKDIAELNEKFTTLEDYRDELVLDLNTEINNNRKIKSDLEMTENLLDDTKNKLEKTLDQLSSTLSKISVLESEIIELNSSKNEYAILAEALQEKYSDLKRNLDIQPQQRKKYKFQGIIDEPGYYRFRSDDAPVVMISFPEPGDCFGWAKDLETNFMTPAFSDEHEVIWTKCFDNSDITVGDIIVFKSGSLTIVHQVIAVQSEGVITKGISNEQADDLVEWDEIEGIVIAIIY